MNFDVLRQKILEKAIRGELVPQLENEPEAAQIGDSPKEVPFAIPEKWKWLKLGSVFRLKAGKFISSSEIKEAGKYPCFGGNGIRGYVDHYNKEGKFPLIGRQGALCGNINIADGRFYATEHAVVADGGELIDSDCAAYFLKQLNLNQYATKTAQPGISVKRISETPFPLPSLEEQRRIVTKINQLFEQIDRAEKAYNELSGPLSDRFRQLCLEKAIQGKLVPQLESEPPVEQIGKLIDKIPFFIPYKWKWIQLKHATTKITDGTHHSPPSSSKGDFLYITAKNIKSSGVDLVNVTYVSKDIHEEIFKRCNPEPGDVLFIKDGATTGVVTINNLEKPFSLLSSVALLKVKREILLPEFLVHVLRSQYTRELIARQMQGTGIPRVTLKKLKELWIPIPPLNEQYRISKKLLNVFAAMPCEN